MDKVDGTLLAATEQSVTLAVSQVLDLRGGTSTWTGERVDIPREGIRGFQERQFSRARTTVLVAAVATVIVGSILAVSLNVFGDPKGEDSLPTTGGTGQTR